jgi:hypothetical protein
MTIFEYVNSYDKSGNIVGQVKRIRSKYFFRFAILAIILGVLSILNGMDWNDTPNATTEQLAIGTRFVLAGCSLIFTLAPCLFLYPIIRGLSLSQKDSWLSAVITFVIEEWFKNKVIDSVIKKKDK